VSTTDATAAPSVQLRTVPISAIVPIDGWNPRVAFDDAELQALSASMLERGCLVPVRVQAIGDGNSSAPRRSTPPSTTTASRTRSTTPRSTAADSPNESRNE